MLAIEAAAHTAPQAARPPGQSPSGAAAHEERARVLQREEERLRHRRRFVVRMTPMALILIVGGLLLAALTSRFLSVFGHVVAISVIGALVALVPLAFGNDPSQRSR